ncbi:hypothetical protein Tco_0248090 [Tanacetum coccineum]
MTKHIEIRNHLMRDSYEKRLIQVINIHTDHNVADLLTKAFDVSRFQSDYKKAKRATEISQSSRPIPFVSDKTVIKEWEDIMERDSTTASSLEAEQDIGNINRTQSMATLNESFPQGTGSNSGPRCQDTILGMQNLKLVGSTEITATIDGKIKIVTKESIRRHLKLEDSDGISNLPTIEIFKQLALMGSKKTAWEQLSSNIATAIICLANNRKSNFSKLIFDGMVKNLKSAPSTSKPHISPTLRSSIRQETEVPQPSSPPHTNVADEAASTGVDVRYGGATKKVYGAAFTKLIKKVKRLEKKDKLSKSRRKLRLVLSDEEGSNSDILAQEDPSKQGRKIAQIDEDEGITLVQMGVSTASIDFTTANVPVTTAGAEISTASPEVKTAGDSVDDIAAESLVYIRRSAAKTKDKGKGIMEESESAMTKTKRQQEQERLGYEV